MKKGFVIRSIATWRSHDGREVSHTSYFERHKTIGRFGFNTMTGDINQAKFYTKKVLALHDLRRFFSGPRAEVVSHLK